MIRAVLFDMDGLMIDTEPYYMRSIRSVAGKFGIEVPDTFFAKLMGRKPIESCTLLVNELKVPMTPAQFLDERDGMVFELMHRELKPMPGLYELLDNLDHGMKLAVVTGARSHFLDLALDKLGIRERFDVLVPSDRVAHGKPDPEIYLKAASELGIPPEECAVLEDSSLGAQAGKRAGCYTIAVPNDHTRDQDFGFVDYVADGLEDACRHILRLVS